MTGAGGITVEEIAAALDSVLVVRHATDEEIAAALTGPDVSCASVARLLRCRKDRVSRIRREMGLAPYQRGRRRTADSWEEAYQARTVAVDGGHMHWTGSTGVRGTPVVGLGGRYRTAYRIGFEIHHGREPEGPVLHLPSCDYPRCVAGAHLADTWLRALMAAKP
ncbi:MULTISPECIES: hypothetical protein [unclassified Streptomyces]|uniref:hypothetical protein n=1 Tax=unclassified Streptomyces TaxID=2593676 RepID=UPI000373DD91|nr:MULTISPECIES: hypothetical protein [unclassified Streptomyces]MYX33453.1 hypothetical protein [Streptomyces sp. SID8377]